MQEKVSESAGAGPQRNTVWSCISLERIITLLVRQSDLPSGTQRSREEQRAAYMSGEYSLKIEQAETSQGIQRTCTQGG